MTNKLFSLSPTNDFEDALKLMTENQIRHCIVTDSEGRLRGVLSDRDVLRGYRAVKNIKPKQSPIS